MDTEHSFFDYSGLADIFTVARTEEIVPLVRVTVATYPYPARALDNIEKLVSIPGVDAVMIGPRDLSLSLGIAGQPKHPRMIEAYEKARAACNRHGVAPGIHLTEADQAKEWLAKGMRIFTFQNDVCMLLDAGKANTDQLRKFIGKKG